MGEFRAVAHEYRTALLLREAARTTDGQLLENFVALNDSSAFETLLLLHGAMVFGVCRRILGNHHDAEDAFQATFLVLAKSAHSIRGKRSVASWLYGVAQRTAIKLKESNARRRDRETAAAEAPKSDCNSPELWRELEPLLDQELERLPAIYREALILCDIEGKTDNEAASRVGTSERAMSMRLHRARKLLAKRLHRRGLVLSAAALALLFSENVAKASVPASLIASTTKVASVSALATAIAAGEISSGVAALTEGVLKTMFIAKLKTTAVLVLLMSIFGMGIGGWLLQTQGADPQAGGKNELPGVQKKADAPIDPEIIAKRQEMLEIAREACEGAMQLYRNARLASADEVCRWSVRWMEAEQALSPNRPAQIQAVEAHLERVKKNEARAAELTANAQGTFVNERTAKYYRVDAERMLLELKK